MTSSRRLPLGLSAAAALATSLGSIGLMTLFSGVDWIPPVLLGVGCVVVGANLSRLAGLPVWMSAPTALLALLAGLTVLYSGGNAAFGVIPTPGAIAALRGQFADGAGYVATTSLPVEPEPGLVALVVAGVGVIAIMVEQCAVTLRRAAIAGYPLLILAAVPMIAADADLPWWTFAAAALGYAVLLGVAHADTTTRWGVTAPASPADTRPVPGAVVSALATTARGLTRPGYLLAVAGIVTAMVVSAIVPGSSGQGLFTGFNALEKLGGDGGRSIETPHPFTSLRGELNQPDPTELLRVQTTDPEPFYLRLTSLDQFTGEGWTQSRLRAGDDDKVSNWDGREPALDAGVPRVAQQTTVEVRGLTNSSYLPVYSNPTDISASGDWRWDSNTGTVFSARDRTGDRVYEFSSQRVPYSGELLSDAAPVDTDTALFERYTALDGPVRPQLRGLVEMLAPTGRSQIDTVRAIEAYFDESNGFRYTERTATGSSGDALVDFLANRQGFCEQYASAMAYLTRAAGIPARVAIGYSRGTPVDEGYISINTRDAHAWVEVYFNGLGWVPFDPTPAAGPGRTADTSWSQPATQPGSSAPPAGAAPPSGADQTPPPSPPDSTGQTPGADLAGPAAGTGGQWPARLGIGVLILLGLALLIGPAIYRVWVRRSRFRRLHNASAAQAAAGHTAPNPHDTRHLITRTSSGAHGYDAADAAWQELTDTAYDLRLLPPEYTAGSRSTTQWRSRHTPREFCTALGTHQLDARGANAIADIATAQERSRYARDTGGVKNLHHAVRAANKALKTRAGVVNAVAAALWPRSVTERVLRSGAERFSVWRGAATQGVTNAQRSLRHTMRRWTQPSRR